MRRLPLEEILSWRKYAYLVGMSEEQVADILGEPRDRGLWGDGVHLTFQNAKLDNRLVTNSRVPNYGQKALRRVTHVAAAVQIRLC